MSDEDYAAFLEKASKDSEAKASTAGSKHAGFTTKSVDVDAKDIPASLKKIDAVYESDTDADWEPVCLSIPSNQSEGGGAGRVDGELFKSVTGYGNKKVEEINVADFDPRGAQDEVVQAVGKAVGSKDGVKVFRTALGGARCEYWVVGVDAKGRLVGLRVEAVES